MSDIDVKENIFGAIESITRQVVDGTPIDLTVVARIVQIRNVEIGEYRVKHQGNTMSAFALDPLTVYRVGEEVYMLVPRGDFSSKKLILGQSRWDAGTSFTDRHEMMNQWMPVGPNWLSPEWYWRDETGARRTDERDQGIVVVAPTELSAVRRLQVTTEGGVQPDTETPARPIESRPAWRGDLFLRRPADYNAERNLPVPTVAQNARTRPATAHMSVSNLADIDSIFAIHSGMVEHFRVQADFMTTFSSMQASGEYGLLIECLIDNPAFGVEGHELYAVPHIIATFRFPCTAFNGNPYGLSVPTPQELVFAVPRDSLKGLVRVSLYQDDNFVTDVQPHYDFSDVDAPQVRWDVPPASHITIRNNVHVSNVRIHFVQQINLDNSMYWIRVDSPRGLDVSPITEGNMSNTAVVLRAHLMYGDRNISEANPDACRFYWYREKVDATSRQTRSATIIRDHDEFGRNWHDYAGDGWAPIAWPFPNDRHRVGLAYRRPGVGAVGSDNAHFGQWPGGSTPNYTVQAINVPRPNPMPDGLPDNFDLPAPHIDRRAAFNELWVPVERVPWRWRYKVVCIYNGVPREDAERSQHDGNRHEVIVSNEGRDPHFFASTVRNSASPFDFEIPNPQTGMGNDNTFLRLRNNPHPWEEYPTFDETIPPLAHRDWWNRWFFIGVNGTNAILGSDNDQYRPGKIQINTFLGAAVMRFAAQIYAPVNGWPVPSTPPGARPEMSDFPATSQPADLQEREWVEIGIAHKTLLAPGENPFYVEFSGTRQFNFFADGTSKLTDWNALQTINAHITWREAQAGTYSVQWIAQDGVTPVTFPGEDVHHVEGLGIDNPRSMMFGVWSPTFGSINNRNSLHFRVREYYEQPTRPMNTFIFRIRLYDGRVFDNPIRIAFTKDGSPGTNGTPWKVDLWPVNSGWADDGLSYERLHYKLHVPRPLRLTGSPTPTSTHSAVPDSANRNNTQLWVRAHVTKRGDAIEQLNPLDNYNMRITWDTRYAPGAFDRSACDTTNLTMRTVSGESFIRVGNPTTGLAAATTQRTHFRPQDTTPGPGFFDEASMRITWGGQSSLNGITLGGVHFACVLRVRVDIYRGEELVSTIFNYYPVDLLFSGGAGGALDINPANMHTNWPRTVNYDAAGYNPWLDNAEPMYFKYGENARYPHPPLPVSAVPQNTNPRLARINQPSSAHREWFYEPNPHFLASEWIYDSVRTHIDSAASGSGDFESWGSAVFLRPIYYRLVTHGNADINAWDGNALVPGVNSQGEVILAPTVGAGWKHPTYNTFTGVIMGVNTAKVRTAYQEIFGGWPAETGFASPFEGDLGHRFMTGLFGYQNGFSSFGIMENGMMYLGRADRGRIVIDGVNAQIYGGASKRTAPGQPTDIGSSNLMPMHNRMRLSFIDFHSSTIESSRPGTPTHEAGGTEGGLGETGVGIMLPNTTGATLENTVGPTIDGCHDISIGTGPLEIPIEFAQYFNWAWTGGGEHNSQAGIANRNDPLIRRRGFGLGHGYSTPAIEIGQYHPDDIEEMVRSLTVCEVRGRALAGRGHTLSTLNIPGYRRFLVTYDGTMYAMNAFIKGNLIGSNVIGSQFFNWDGSFAITERGNLGIGISTDGGHMSDHIGDWDASSINFDEQNHRELWSPEIPFVDVYPISEVIRTDPRTSQEEAEANRNDFLGLGCEHDLIGEGQAFNFFVTNTGRVIARDLHVQGGSLNIGNFYIIGNEEPNGGDIISFGTMYLVGVEEPPTSKEEADEISDAGVFRNALEAWGNVYLRGKLTNLGNVFLGSSIEKRTGLEPTPPGIGYVPNSMNSPFAIVPTQERDPGLAGLSEREELPTQIGIWPLYMFAGQRDGEIDEGGDGEDSVATSFVAASEDDDNGEEPGPTPAEWINNTWVTFARNNPGATNNGFMPGFADRPSLHALRFFWRVDHPRLGGYWFDLSRVVRWRIDQLGMWSDGILLTHEDWVDQPDDQTAMDMDLHALGYIGWYRTGSLWPGSPATMNGFAIKNVAANAASMVFETPGALRITAGRDDELRGALGDDSFPADRSMVVLQTLYRGSAGGRAGGQIILKGGGSPAPPAPENGDETTSSSITPFSDEPPGDAGGGSDTDDSATVVAGVVSLIGMAEGRETHQNRQQIIEDTQCFIFVNGLNFSNEPITDERNLNIAVTPSQATGVATGAADAENRRGRIWIKGKGVAIDAVRLDAWDQVTDPAGPYNSCVRINRSYNGQQGTGAPTELPPNVGSDGVVAIRSDDVVIRANPRPGAPSHNAERWGTLAGTGSVYIFAGGDSDPIENAHTIAGVMFRGAEADGISYLRATGDHISICRRTGLRHGGNNHSDCGTGFADGVSMWQSNLMIHHQNHAQIAVGQSQGEQWVAGGSDGIVGVEMFFAEERISFGNGPGEIRGTGSEIHFLRDWAEPENQHGIYARFA